MFATRGNNENAIYEQQQAAAAKPLNQSIKGLAPKTPANKAPKTPFGKTRHDENAQLDFGKTNGKGGKAERNAFLTPANPTTRAPLGNKTTNAKALQTPALLKAPGKDEKSSSNKATSPRLRRSKIKVHETSTDAENVLAEDPEEREIEYMPAREVPLPDYDDELWPHDRQYPQFEGKNLTRGWWSEFAPKKDEDEPDLSDYEEKLRQLEERKKKERQKEPKPATHKPATNAALRSGPPTKQAYKAASALSAKPTSAITSRLAAPTASSAARAPATSTQAGSKKPMFERGNPRFTAAKAASNNTIGYSKGRIVSAHRHPLLDVHKEPVSDKPAEKPDNKKYLDELLAIGSLEVADDDADLDFGGDNVDFDPFTQDDDLSVFQLDPSKTRKSFTRSPPPP